ncbi:hypothetical protein LOK49_LG15G01275 [Camellia lanceoleosa]|uniref:Uncharacterized protein n=1 Tax=Camellia lanceoleosa TaxID=1840588 RepID=A0ACC0F1S3_9ERIC|nr:hypothetical protein LOK49_LG15G01275 [Camellia lanceoleosa]
MGLDVKNIQVCIWRVLHLFVVSSCTFAKKYPKFSAILLFFSILYMFLLPVFTFLVYTLPILIFIVVVFRLIFRIHQQNLRNAKGIPSQKPTFVEDNIVVENSSTQPLPVIRRNVKEKDKQVFMQEGVEEKDMVFSAISNDDLVDKAALIEENPKEMREVKVDSVTDRAESLIDASRGSMPGRGNVSEGMSDKSNGGGGELEVESSDDAEDEDEEEAQEDGNKAVEWTEVDQKNLMDLGISEMERNKRLESLIAKRRARKLLSIQVRRTLMNMGSNDPCGQIASILIPKVNHFPPNSSGEAAVSPIPGSAPSVLLPMHNPFDLPYDPEEEKPNLMEDNFEEEFVAAPQKDMMFCRHESFSLGAFFPGPVEFDQSRRETFYCPNFDTKHRVAEIPEYSGIRKQSGKEDPSKQIEPESSQEGESMMHINSSRDLDTQQGQASEQVFNLVDIHHEDDRSEVDTGSNVVRDASGESSSSSSSEMNPPFSDANKEQILKSLSFSIRKNIDRENNASRNELLYDGIPSSFEKKGRGERFFCADNGYDHNRTHSIASDLQVEVSDIGSPTLTVDETISPSDGEHLMSDGDVDLDKQTTCGGEEMWVASSQLSEVDENESRSRGVHEVSQQDLIEVGFSRNNKKSEDLIESDMLPEKVVEQDSIDTSVSSSKIEVPESSQAHLMDFNGKAHDENGNWTNHCSYHDTKQKRSDSPEKSTQEADIIHDMNDQVVFAKDDREIMEFIKDTYGEAPILTKQEAPEDLSARTMNNTEPAEITEGDYGLPESDHSDSTECIEGEFKRKSEQGSNLIGNKNIQYREDEQSVVDVGSFGYNWNSTDPIASVMQPEIIAKEGPPDSSLSLSPTSVTEGDVPISEVSLSDFDHTTQTKDHQLSADMVKNNFSDKLLPESSILTVSNDRDLEKPQGDHQTFLESYKPVEENVNSKSSEDFEAQLEKKAKHKDSPSREIEKMDISESIQDRECERGAIDVGFSGVSQSSNDPIPSAMLPESMVEKVPIPLSSSLSPKYDSHKTVSIEQTSSSCTDPETHLKVQNSDEQMAEINLLDNLLPENLTPLAPQNALNLSLDSTANPSYDKDHKELQEPSNPPKESTQELNSISGVNDSEVPANDDMRNLKTIDDVNSESHILPKEANAGALSRIPEERISNSIDIEYIEGQSEKRGEDQNMLESYKPIANDYEGEHSNQANFENIAEISNSVQNNDILESPQESEQKIVEIGIYGVSPSTDGPIASVMLTGTVESGLFGFNQSLISDPSLPALMPEIMVEHVPIIASSSLSPKSVLQENFPIDQASISSFDQETHMGVPQSETEMEENNQLDGFPPENLTATMPKNALHLMEDSTGNLQEPPNSHGKSTKEDSLNCDINDSTSNENEEKLNSKSVEEDEGQQKLLIKQEALADPMEPSDVTNIEGPGGRLEQLTNTGDVIGKSKPMEQNENSGTTKRFEKFEESMKSNDVGGPSMPTNSKDNLEASEIVDGKSKNLTAYEANDVGLSKPADQNDDSNISLNSKEREEQSRADPGRSIGGDNMISNENELVLNAKVGEEDLRSSVGDTEAESQRLMRSVDFAEQSEKEEVVDSSTIENDEGKSNKPTESEPTVKNDNLHNTKDTEDNRKSIDHENVMPKTGQSSDGLDHLEKSKGKTKDFIKDDV